MERKATYVARLQPHGGLEPASDGWRSKCTAELGDPRSTTSSARTRKPCWLTHEYSFVPNACLLQSSTTAQATCARGRGLSSPMFYPEKLFQRTLVSIWSRTKTVASRPPLVLPSLARLAPRALSLQELQHMRLHRWWQLLHLIKAASGVRGAPSKVQRLTCR